MRCFRIDWAASGTKMILYSRRLLRVICNPSLNSTGKSISRHVFVNLKEYIFNSILRLIWSQSYKNLPVLKCLGQILNRRLLILLSTDFGLLYIKLYVEVWGFRKHVSKYSRFQFTSYKQRNFFGMSGISSASKLFEFVTVLVCDRANLPSDIISFIF